MRPVQSVNRPMNWWGIGIDHLSGHLRGIEPPFDDVIRRKIKIGRLSVFQNMDRCELVM